MTSFASEELMEVFTCCLSAPDLQSQDAFGSSLAADGNVVVIGAPGVPLYPGYDGAGTAYVYEFDGAAWLERAKLSPPDPQEKDTFGASVALGSGRLLIGAPYEDGTCKKDCRKGKAYLFEGAGKKWSLIEALVPGDLATGDEFATALALDGDEVMVGAPLHDSSGADSGAAYLFDLAPLGTRYCDSNANSTGKRAGVSARGSRVIADNCVLLQGWQLPVDRFGYFMMSQGTDFVPFFGGSQGTLCLSAPIVRFAQDALWTGSSGLVEFRPDLTDLPSGVQFAPGETWHFQLWFRDANPTPTSNTTDGLAVTWL